MTDVLLKIVVNEQQHEKRNSTCREILTYLLDQGVKGATMRRGVAGLNFNRAISLDLLEDTYFNDLPIVIESVMDRAAAKELEGGLGEMIGHGQISIMSGTDDNIIKNHTHYIVKVYTRENSHFIKKDEYEKILLLLKKHNAIWATVTKAIAGYGSDRVIYGQHVFSTSEHLPLVIECVVEKEILPNLLDELNAIVTEGTVFTAPVELIINK